MTQHTVYQAQIAMGGLPVNLVLISSGEVALIKNRRFQALYCDYSIDGKIPAIISEQNVVIGTGEDAVEYAFDTLYKLADRDTLRSWLKQLNLEQPQ